MGVNPCFSSTRWYGRGVRTWQDYLGMVAVAGVLGLLGGYWLGRAEPIPTEDVESFVDVTRSVWRAMDEYEARLAHEAQDVRIGLLMGEVEEGEAGLAIQKRTEAESQHVRATIHGARSVLGEPIARSLEQRARVLLLRWQAEVHVGGARADVIADYERHLQASRFDMLQAREHALRRVGF